MSLEDKIIADLKKQISSVEWTLVGGPFVNIEPFKKYKKFRPIHEDYDISLPGGDEQDLYKEVGSYV